MFDLTTSTVKALAYLGQKYLHPWFLFLLLNDGLSSFSLHYLVCPPFSRQSDRLKPSSNAYLSLLKALWTLTLKGKKKIKLLSTTFHNLSPSWHDLYTWVPSDIVTSAISNSLTPLSLEPLYPKSPQPITIPTRWMPTDYFNTSLKYYLLWEAFLNSPES